MEALLEDAKRHWRVAVVEDSTTDAKLILKALLEDDRDLQVTVLTDGERAAGHLLEQPAEEGPLSGDPDLLLLDLNLPRRNGLDLLEDLRRRLPSTPIVVFSSTQLPGEIRRCYDLGANCVATKPLDLDDFVKTVQSIEHYWLDVLGPRGRGRHGGSPLWSLP